MKKLLLLVILLIAVSGCSMFPDSVWPNKNDVHELFSDTTAAPSRVFGRT